MCNRFYYGSVLRNSTRYKQANFDCLPCPVGAGCSQEDLMLNDVESLAGYYAKLNPPTAGALGFMQCFNPVACVGGNACQIGFTGALCAVCAKGYASDSIIANFLTFYVDAYDCFECPSDSFTVLKTAFVVIGAVILYIIYVYFIRVINTTEPVQNDKSLEGKDILTKAKLKDTTNLSPFVAQIGIGMLQFNSLATTYVFLMFLK